MKSGNLNFLEHSGPLQACNGTALTYVWTWFIFALCRSADKTLDWPDWKNNWKVAIFLPTRMSLLPRRPGWTDKHLNCFWVVCKCLVAVACLLPGRAKDLSAHRLLVCSIGWMIVTNRTEIVVANPLSVPLCATHIPHTEWPGTKSIPALWDIVSISRHSMCGYSVNKLPPGSVSS